MISIIVVTFNSEKCIKPCLDSIFAQEYWDLEVIVIDNGSKDGTVSIIKNNYPQAAVIENKENLGACKARNQGIRVAKGKWILTLDCDVILAADFFKSTANTLANVPATVGIIQPKILKTDRGTIYSTGIFLSSLRRFYDIDRDKPDNSRFNNSKYIFGACAACAVYRRSMLEDIKEKTGFFDERFFFLVEDVDLSWRAQKIGWKAKFIPEMVCYHAGNSSGYDKSFRQYLCFRNRRYMVAKNENIFGKIKLIPIFFVYDFPRSLYISLNRKIKKEVTG